MQGCIKLAERAKYLETSYGTDADPLQREEVLLAAQPHVGVFLERTTHAYNGNNSDHFGAQYVKKS